MGHIDPWSSNNVFLIPKARRPPKIFNVQLFNFFGNECQNGLVWTYKVWKGTKSWNLVNLALIFEQWQTNLSAQGHIDPWSSEIGLNVFGLQFNQCKNWEKSCKNYVLLQTNYCCWIDVKIIFKNCEVKTYSTLFFLHSNLLN